MAKAQLIQRSLLVLGIMLIVCNPLTVAYAGYPEIFSEYLKMGPATYLKLNVHGRTSQDIDKRLSEIYYSNKLQPFWIKDGKPGPRALDIRTTLEAAYHHGLDPGAYLVTNIQQFWNARDISELARLDVLLTLGMLRYVADQREGRIEPQLIDPVLFATARDVVVDWTALVKAALQAKDMKVFLDQQAPPFYQYHQLKIKLADYRSIAQQGGWLEIPPGQTLKPGMKDQRIMSIRKRLAVTGEFSSNNFGSTVFDSDLAKSVKRFQKYHNLTADGIVGNQSLDAMNVSVSKRIEQIVVNLERYRWLTRIESEDLVVVNIAAFQAFAGKPGSFEIKMPVIVGKTYHQTPVFNNAIKHVVINPYWNVPPSIAQNEILPKQQKDPLYLKKNHMRMFQGWGADAPEIDVATIDWNTMTSKQMNTYRIRQDPGPHNALGTLKLMFPNEYNVYLHDTPAHELFDRDRRVFSHGCIRMGRPAEMAAYVLGGEGNGWTVKRIKDIVATKERHVIKLKKPMPVLILYRTALVGADDGSIYFYEDIYGRDKLLARALSGKN